MQTSSIKAEAGELSYGQAGVFLACLERVFLPHAHHALCNTLLMRRFKIRQYSKRKNVFRISLWKFPVKLANTFLMVLHWDFWTRRCPWIEGVWSNSLGWVICEGISGSILYVYLRFEFAVSCAAVTVAVSDIPVWIKGELCKGRAWED